MSTVESSIPSQSYQVPALDKGLDILECLAQGAPLTQAQIARTLGRGPNELFRMLVCLERRGYIQRDPLSSTYSLTLRLFELSHMHSPLQGLVQAAAQPIRALSETVRESCHLGVLYRGALLVLAQAESPDPLRLSVEVGGRFPLLRTVSGRLLLANLSLPRRDDILRHDNDYAAMGGDERARLGQRLEMIRARHYEEAVSETMEGVHDYSVLVGASDGEIQAALTVPILRRTRVPEKEELLEALWHCAAEISRAAGLVV